MNPKGQLAVVTGASSGIGKAVALDLAKEGARLVLAARRLPDLESVAESCRALGAETRVVTTDVSQREECEELIRAAGDVDILVNNAGYAIFDRLADATPHDLESMMQTNYFGAIWCMKAALPGMIARRSGAIVNVASITGIMGFAGMGGYCATKFALVGVTEALRDEMMGLGVSVSAVCPGTTRTDFFRTAEKGKMPGASRLLIAIPPERVARAVTRAIRTGRARIVVPFGAGAFMKFKEIAPSAAHMLMRRVSSIIGAGAHS